MQPIWHSNFEKENGEEGTAKKSSCKEAKAQS
jgi:hypothetical protein